MNEWMNEWMVDSQSHWIVVGLVQFSSDQFVCFVFIAFTFCFISFHFSSFRFVSCLASSIKESKRRKKNRFKFQRQAASMYIASEDIVGHYHPNSQPVEVAIAKKKPNHSRHFILFMISIRHFAVVVVLCFRSFTTFP